jgi:hypothetical protein
LKPGQFKYVASEGKTELADAPTYAEDRTFTEK